MLGEDEQRLLIERGECVRVSALSRGGDPAFVFAEEVPDGAQEFRRVHFEIEVNDDERPTRTVVLLQRLLDDRPDPLEEVCAEIDLGAGDVLRVRDDDTAFAGGAIDVPGEVLLDTDGEAEGERALDAVGPLALVGVAVVGVQERAVRSAGRACPGRRRAAPGAPESIISFPDRISAARLVKMS